MKRNYLSILLTCGLLTLVSCGGSDSSSENLILGNINKYVKNMYEKSNAAAAYDQQVFQNEGDMDKNKSKRLNKDLVEAYERLMQEKDKAIGNELPTEVREGTPLKVVKPFTVVKVEVSSRGGWGSIELKEGNDEMTTWLNGGKLQGAKMYVTLKAELELTEDIKAQKGSWSAMGTRYESTIKCYAATESDSIIANYAGIQYDYSVANQTGTKVALTYALSDESHHPFNEEEDQYYYIEKLSQIKKFTVVWEDAPISATLSADAVPGELGLFELRGPVKKCTVINEWGNIVRTFDEKGFWKANDGQPISNIYVGGIERDEYGRIVKGMIDEEGNGETYTYNKDGNVVKYGNVYYDSIDETTLTYDDKGYVIKRHNVTGGVDAGAPYDVTYSDVKLDEHGNWTSRKTSEGEIEKRKIEYY